MGKLVLMIVVVLVAVWWFWGRRPREHSSSDGARDRAHRGRDAQKLPLAMTACAHCGVHLPESEAVRDEREAAYCSEAHRRLGPRP